MARIVALLFVCGLALGCSKSAQPSASQGSAPTAGSSPAAANSTPLTNGNSSPPLAKIDSCKVLTSDDLKSVQGEALKETKASDRADGGFNISQCFYTLPTFTKSVSVAITSAGTRDPKAFWKETFHRDEAEEKDRDRKGKASREDKSRRGEEEAESAPPQKVTGVGDEAFWMGSRIGGALYVLKQNVFFRISLGGPDDQKTKLNKSKTLAKTILSRL